MGGENGHRTRGPGPSLGWEGDGQVLPSSADPELPQGHQHPASWEAEPGQGQGLLLPCGSRWWLGWGQTQALPMCSGCPRRGWARRRHGAASSHADSSEEATEGHWVPRDDHLMPEAGPANRACARACGRDTAQLHPPAQPLGTPACPKCR